MQAIRLKYVDGLKGFAILFVVFYHLIWVCVKDRDSVIVPIFNSLCMQLFFFISGYVSYRGMSRIITIKDFRQDIIKRIKRLLMPTVLMFLFCIWYYEQDLKGQLLYEFKSGYWFTYVLFFICLIHYVTILIIRKLGRIKLLKRFLIPLLILMTFIAYWHCGTPYRLCNCLRVFSTMHILKYYVFFLLGYLSCQYTVVVKRSLDIEYVRFLMIIMTVLSLCCVNISPPIRPIISFGGSIAQILIVFCLFQEWEERTSNNKILNQLSYIGKHSMEIYFIHYYFIFGMPELHSFIEQDTLFVFRGTGSKVIIEIACLLPISIFLVYFSIFIRRLFDFCPCISECLFGPIPK